MAVTTQNSAQFANQIAVPAVRLTTKELGGRARLVIATHTQSGVGDANSLINFFRLERPRGPEQDLIALAWSPCYAPNHTPRRFGTIIFSRD